MDSGSSSGGDSSVHDGSSGSSGGPDGGSSGSIGGEGGSPPACDGGAPAWRCKVDTSCASPTTLTGKVYDPAGKNPLYNVIVFIPNDPAALPRISPGTHSCNTCDAPIDDYVVATTTDYQGSFTLTGVPAGAGVPVTVQLGKWRRTTYVDIGSDCGMNTAVDKTLHLPGSRAEGDMPQMALLTGGCEDMGCFMMNMGIAPSEFGPPHGGGRVDVYQGNGSVGGAGPGLSSGTPGNCTTTSCPLWSSKSSLEYYDLSVFSCECSEQTTVNESPAAYTNLHDWVDEGGRVLASHFNYTWFENNPDPAWAATATWLGHSVASGSGTEDIDDSFFEGEVFGQWLGNVGALSSSGPPPTAALANLSTSVSTVNPSTTQRWIYDPSTSPSDTKLLSFETPVGGVAGSQDASAGRSYCGKAAFTDLHSSSGLLAAAQNIPGDCAAANLTSQQKALEFLFFDLSACVAADGAVPPLPPPSQ